MANEGREGRRLSGKETRRSPHRALEERLFVPLEAQRFAESHDAVAVVDSSYLNKTERLEKKSHEAAKHPHRGTLSQETGRFLSAVWEGLSHGTLRERLFIVLGMAITGLGIWFTLPLGTAVTAGALALSFPALVAPVAEALVSAPILGWVAINIEALLIPLGWTLLSFGPSCVRKPSARFAWVTVETAVNGVGSGVKGLADEMAWGLRLDLLTKACDESKNPIVRSGWGLLKGVGRAIGTGAQFIWKGVGKIFKEKTKLDKAEQWIFHSDADELSMVGESGIHQTTAK